MLVPILNLWEDDKSFHAEVEVPGIQMDDLKMELTDRTLTIKGAWGPCLREPMDNDRSNLIHERAEGEFNRSVHLPCEVNPEKAKATLKNGVLF